MAGKGGQTRHRRWTNDDTSTGDSSQARDRAIEAFGWGRRSGGRGSTLGIPRVVSAGVQPTPRRPRSDTTMGLHSFSAQTRGAPRNPAPLGFFAGRRFGSTSGSTRSARLCGSTAWQRSSAARHPNSIPIFRFLTLLEPFPPLFQPSEERARLPCTGDGG
ncbi:uncharacterized protein LOC111433435 [Cucurbita moschata]|uniref:Uncharacterized protein LOC111433435 n=1 Tax=Cucurbita moschata TaxID=3662 RepID=A0A6J1EEC3_CUCMO|nr:uncharacterized protein LOC111433435 [Cucurbita moschata]